LIEYPEVGTAESVAAGASSIHILMRALKILRDARPIQVQNAETRAGIEYITVTRLLE
jgi:hypothetical protein